MTDEQWEVVRCHLPPQKPPTGRPAKDHRTVVDGILWQLRSGAPWRDLPARFGPWQTVYSRWRRWQRAGVWDRVLVALVACGEADSIVLGGRDARVRAHHVRPVIDPEVSPKPVAAAPSGPPPRSNPGSSGSANRWAW